MLNIQKNNFEIVKIIILNKNRTPIWGFDFLCIVENNKIANVFDIDIMDLFSFVI